MNTRSGGLEDHRRSIDYSRFLQQVSKRFALPSQGLFMGIGVEEKGLPALFNLPDTKQGPLLFIADAGGEKTAFLRSIARGADIMHRPSVLRYGIITPHPEEWDGFRRTNNLLAVFEAGGRKTPEYLSALVTTKRPEVLLLLIDNLAEVTKKLDEKSLRTLRWLLEHGSKKLIWPIATVNTEDAYGSSGWMDFFRSRLFGYIKNREQAAALARRLPESPPVVQRGEFAMCENNRDWSIGWIPDFK